MVALVVHQATVCAVAFCCLSTGIDLKSHIGFNAQARVQPTLSKSG
jgi:hypothetical protein